MKGCRVQSSRAGLHDRPAQVVWSALLVVHSSMPLWLLLAVCTVQLWQPARAQGAEYVAQDSSWKAVVQAATAGDTVKFLPGVYAGCDGVSLGSGRPCLLALFLLQRRAAQNEYSRVCCAGVTLTASGSEGDVVIDCANTARSVCVRASTGACACSSVHVRKQVARRSAPAE